MDHIFEQVNQIKGVFTTVIVGEVIDRKMEGKDLTIFLQDLVF